MKGFGTRGILYLKVGLDMKFKKRILAYVYPFSVEEKTDYGFIFHQRGRLSVMNEQTKCNDTNVALRGR